MNKYYKSIDQSNEEELGKNPYDVPSLVIPIREWHKHAGKDKEGKDKFEDLTFEYKKFTKVYSVPENRKLIAKLSDKAKSLYLWIIQVVPEGQKYFWMNRDLYTEENDIKSNTTIVNAIKELVKAQIISKSGVTNYYWINPEFFFCGNRLKAFPKNCVPYNEINRTTTEDKRDREELS